VDKDDRLASWERRSEVPLGVASLLYLGSYAVRVLGPGLPDAVRDSALALTCATWAMFIVDYGVRWRLSGQGPGFVRRHWLDTVVMVLPLLRPVQIVKVNEAVQHRQGQPRLALHARVILYATLSVGLLGFAAALTVYHVEHDAPHATIRTFGDSVWWTCSTLGTVGYGDVVPVTPTGRVIAVGLMGVGLALLGAVTGSFSAWLLQVLSREDDDRPRGS
jgi:voltage-gated potassium channel